MTRMRGPMFILVLAALTIVGCDADTDTTAESPNNDRNAIEFKVDGDGVSYLYRHPSRGLHVAARLAQIPLEHRVAVIVVTADRDAPSFEAGSAPVADLLEAIPGDDGTAVWLTKKRFVRRNLAAELGHERANGIRFWAQEVTQLSPNSERARSSDRALRLLEELEPPPSDNRPDFRPDDRPPRREDTP